MNSNRVEISIGKINNEDKNVGIYYKPILWEKRQCWLFKTFEDLANTKSSELV